MRRDLLGIGIVILTLVVAGFGGHYLSLSADAEPAFDDINVALRMAVRESDLGEVTKLLNSGADPNSDFYGNTPLSLAIQWGDLELVQTLVDAGANVSKTGLRGRSPLAATNWKPNYEMADYLLEQGADVNAADESGYTPLHWAAINSDPQMVELLLEHGADVNAETKYGGNALNHSIEDLDPKVVQLLIDHGSDIEDKGIGEDRPLHNAITNIAVMQVLLDNGADANARNSWGNTPLHEAVSKMMSGSIPENPDDPAEVIRFLVKNGADIEARNDRGYTPVMNCQFDEGTELLELLVGLGADINALDDRGDTMLHNVAQEYRGQSETARALMQLGVDPEITNNQGNKPIYNALIRDNLELVDALLEAGAEYDLAVAAGKGDMEYVKQAMSGLHTSNRDPVLERKAISLAAYGEHLDVVDYLLGQGATARLVDMVRIGYIDEIQRLIDGGADVNEDVDRGYTALHKAASDGQNDIIELLVKNGADLDAHAEMMGRTPLERAIRGRHLGTLKLLLDLGADPDAQFHWGQTALHWAVNRDPEYVHYLLENGANVNAVGDDLTTPLHAAVYRDNLEVVNLLIAAGANLDAQNDFGWTPLLSGMAGMRAESTGCLEALLAAGADPDIADELGFTPLLQAVMKGQNADVELLLKFGADIEYTTDYGYTALLFAISSDLGDIAAILRKHGAKEPSIEMLWDIEHMEMPGG